MNGQMLPHFIGRNPMDRAMIVGQVMQHCKRVIDNVLEAADLQTVATASLTIFDQIREVAGALLQAKVDLEAHTLHSHPVTSCCPGAALKYVHTRTVPPTTLFGPLTIPVRPFQCEECGATQRPDDAPLGVPLVGEFPDDIRCLYPPLVAELPHRIASDIFARFPGVTLSSRGAQGLIDSSAADHHAWRQKTERQDQTAVVEVLAGPDASRLRLEMAMDGVTAPIDRRWQEPQVATGLVRHLPQGVQVPTRGAVRARRYVCVLGTADDLVERITAVIRAAGWDSIPVAEIVGDGAAWIWNVATEHYPGVRQVLDYSHLSEHLDELAHLLYPEAPERAKAWGEEKLAALLTDRGGDVLGALKRRRPRQPTVWEGLHALIGYVASNRNRIYSQEPWHQG